MFRLRAEPHEYLAAFGARLAIWMFGALPLPMASRFGGWLARTVGPRLNSHRIAARQMARALPELDEAARAAALRGMWDNLGRVMAELPHLNEFRLGETLEISGEHHLDAFRGGKASAIFISGHYGNWELMSAAARSYDIPLVFVYRAANNPLVEEMLQNLRGSSGVRHVPKGVRAARALITALQNRESLGILVDQKLNSGVAVPFFGQSAMTAPAPIELALRSGCPIVPVRVCRVEGIRFRLEIEAPIQLTATGNRDADMLAGLQQMNGILERWIRERPDHWFWVHRRWPKE